MFCKKCGAPITPKQRECPNCGEPVPDLSYFSEWPKISADPQDSAPVKPGTPVSPKDPTQSKKFARQVLQELDQIKKLAQRTPRGLLAVSLAALLCALLTLSQISSVKSGIKEINTGLAQLSTEAVQESEEAETAATEATEPTGAATQGSDTYTENLEWTLHVTSLTLAQDEMVELFSEDGAVYFCIARQENAEGSARYVPQIQVAEDYGDPADVQYIWTSEDGVDLTSWVDENGVLTFSGDSLERYVSGALTLRIHCSAIWTNDAGGTITANVGYIVVTLAGQTV